MKKKQVLGILAACLILIVTGMIGVGSSLYLNKKMSSSQKAAESLEDVLSVTSKGMELPKEDFIGQIDIVGTIQAEENVSNSVTGSAQYRHKFYLDYIDRMENAPNNKGIFLFVNSPGGTVYESDEMYLKLMEYKEKTGRPIYAYFADTACSGAYYISMAADEIYANRNTWTGSIGVIISLMNYEGLMKKIGVTEIDITSGSNKTIGSGAHAMTKEQQKILQTMVDESYDQFTRIVANGRDMDLSKVKKLADGRIYTASQAKKYGLIDEVMGLDEAKAAIASSLGEDGINYFAPKKNQLFQGIFGEIIGAAAQFGNKSDIQAARELIENDESGVLMYYAK